MILKTSLKLSWYLNRKAILHVPIPPASSGWILATGNWDDAGQWTDSDVWNDN